VKEQVREYFHVALNVCAASMYLRLWGRKASLINIRSGRESQVGRKAPEAESLGAPKSPNSVANTFFNTDTFKIS